MIWHEWPDGRAVKGGSDVLTKFNNALMARKEKYPNYKLKKNKE